jgi:hypothetical protein
MLHSTSDTSRADLGPRTWTGYLEFPVVHGRGRSVIVHLAVHLDDITFYVRDHTMAVMDRDLFRNWLHDHDPRTFQVDQVAWVVRASQVWITIQHSGVPIVSASHGTVSDPVLSSRSVSYLVLPDTVQCLRQVM